MTRSRSKRRRRHAIPLRSFLFAPGNHPRRVEKALTLDADAVILDLEDAVAIAEKPATRSAIVAAYGQARIGLLYVRVNAADTAFCHGDFTAIVRTGLDGIILPKVESAATIQTIDWLLGNLERERGLAPGGIDLIPIIETAKGLRDIDAILTCNGQIVNVVKAEGGARQVSLYAMQSAENWFEDFGSGVLTNGAMTVPLDPIFASTVNTAIDYHVFLTPRGECEGLYVTNLTPSGFEVRELHHGSSNIAFDYRIVAKRAGYENQRLEDVTERYQEMREQEEKRRQRMAHLRAARAVSALPVPPATRAVAP